MLGGDNVGEPVLRVSAVLGNAADGDWAARLRGSRVDQLALDAVEAQRSRLRKRSANGIDVAIALERGVQLRDGDVLGWDEPRRTAVVARIDLRDVLVIDLGSLLGEPAETVLSRCVEVGHALGNQHWPTVVKGSRVYVPLTLARKVMEAVLEAHQLAGVRWWFARGAEVSPCLSPPETRRLFGAVQGHDHNGDHGSLLPEAQ
jgi:urease accessory protein